MYSEFLLKEALETCDGVGVNGFNLTNIRYADDTVLLADNVQALQQMIDSLCFTCKSYGMELNAKKTKTMCISKNTPPTILLNAEGTSLDQVHEYQYLGSTITDDGRVDEEIKRRIGKAKAKFWDCKEFLRRNLNLNLKLRLLRCYVFSVLAYGCESWQFNNNVKRKLQSFEMWCFRRLLKISWRDRVSNANILARLQTERNLICNLSQRKLSYAGHVLRGSAGILHNIILEGCIAGRRARGRQRGKWSDDVKLWTNSATYAEAKRKAENRVRWRAMVANLRFEDGT